MAFDYLLSIGDQYFEEEIPKLESLFSLMLIGVLEREFWGSLCAPSIWMSMWGLLTLDGIWSLILFTVSYTL